MREVAAKASVLTVDDSPRIRTIRVALLGASRTGRCTGVEQEMIQAVAKTKRLFTAPVLRGWLPEGDAISPAGSPKVHSRGLSQRRPCTRQENLPVRLICSPHGRARLSSYQATWSRPVTPEPSANLVPPSSPPFDRWLRCAGAPDNDTSLLI